MPQSNNNAGSQFFGHWRDSQTIAARDIADHHIDTLRKIAKLGDLLLRTAGFVDDDQLICWPPNPFVAYGA